MSDKLQFLAEQFQDKPTEENFSKLYNHLKPKLQTVANYYSKDEMFINSVVNEAFSIVWQKIDKYNRHWRFSTWINAITRNAAKNTLRQNKRIPFSISDEKIFDMIEYTPASEFEFLCGKFTPSDLKELINETEILEDRERIFLIKKYYEGWSLKELAFFYDMNLNTVKSTLFRARNKLKEYVKRKNIKNKSIII